MTLHREKEQTHSIYGLSFSKNTNEQKKKGVKPTVNAAILSSAKKKQNSCLCTQ